ncbi:MAG: AAA family ATPase, partial [Leptospiraceae bacterium]|nr:AAA family ATPase [Leptospiraceae bacterium]
MASVQIAGYNVPSFHEDPGWIPETNIILTPTTTANLRKILPAIVQNRPLLLVGDAGVGKNALIYYINSLRKHPTIRYSFNEDTLPEDLVGSYRLDPNTHGFVWSDGPLSQAMRQGSTFVADEMNLASPEVLKRFQSIFSDHYLEMLEGDATRIDPAPGFQFVATQNPAEGFEGRKNLPREIQKYFITVYLDAYPTAELVSILHGLFPEVPQDILNAVVHINRDVEDAVIRKKIGSRDLERYHFNLRNLTRLTRRIEDKPSALYQELQDVYLRPFRTTEDHVEVKGMFENRLKEFGLWTLLDKKEKATELAANSDGRFSIGRAVLNISEFHTSNAPDAETFQTNLEKAAREFVPVPARADILESIGRAIQFKENVLLEGDADVEPDEYVRFFARALGRDLHVVTLSRGMHTADVMGGLKPASGAGKEAAVDWVDGPLTRAVKNGEFILIQGLEAAGPELVEKLNMLMDDARALMLPPESGSNDPVFLPGESRIFGVKFYRSQRTAPTVSRAFRNRFTCYTIPTVEDPESIRAILRSELGLDDEEGKELVRLMQQFHTLIREKARKREIGAANLQPYRYGLTNLRRFSDSIGWAVVEPENLSESKLREILQEGAGIAYLNEIADPVEREKMFQM